MLLSPGVCCQRDYICIDSKIMCSTMRYWKRGIMRLSFCLATLLIFLPTIGSSQPANQDPAQSDAAAITVYKDFAVVRSTIDLDLKRSEEHTAELQSRPHLVC